MIKSSERKKRYNIKYGVGGGGLNKKVTFEESLKVGIGHECEQTPGDGEGQESLAYCSRWCCKELDTSERLNSNNGDYKSTEAPWSTVRTLGSALKGEAVAPF